MSDPLAAWQVDEADFPAGGPPAERSRFALRYAILAQSGHNIQPWLFGVRDDGTVELHADRTRALPVADPEDRELTIACGAALFHLLTALRHVGTAPRAALLPDQADPDLLARVEPRGGRPAEDEDHAMLRAIPARRTGRAGRSRALRRPARVAGRGRAPSARPRWSHRRRRRP